MLGAILFGTSGALYAPAISAQDSSGASGFDEVIVTATKKGKEENIQDVPLAVTAFDGALIEKTQLRTVQDEGVTEFLYSWIGRYIFSPRP